ncbi:MAG: SPOR domain-containing protein [Chitinispirillaceae bacterium]|nr:SPOR domain-containing protein [Chitinispirillaceae bacterium]
MTRAVPLIAVCISLLPLFYVSTVQALPDTDYTVGCDLFSKGRYTEAAAKLASAFKAHPTNSGIAFAYARVAPCSVAVAIFTRCANDTTVPDSLRAASYKELGDYSFVHSAFKTAAEKYRLASSLRSEAQYRHCWALASAALHDVATARSLWQTITLEHGSDLALEAWYHLALIDMEESLYDSAFVKLETCGPPDTSRAWTVAAAAAKLECAVRLGKTKTAASLEKKLKPFEEHLLERDLLTLADLHSGIKKENPKSAKSVADNVENAGVYTLQVGAFGAIDNATGLQKKLEVSFDDVTVVPVTLGDQVFYRVRVGTFKSKETAEAFGNDSLKSAGIAFKAVTK